MSIYATIWDLADDDHDFTCARMVQVAGFDAAWETDPDKPCTCHAGPIAYRGSHILPSDDDPRGGCLDLGAIPGFISRADRVLCDDDDQCPKPATVCCDRHWPYLRVSVNHESVVLTRDHVAQVHAVLGRWLANTNPKTPAVKLTPRELQVLHAIAAGKTATQIGRDLGTSVNTIHSQTRHLYRKLAVHTRVGAVNTARELGLLDEDGA